MTLIRGTIKKISELTDGTPDGNDVIPFSTSTETKKTTKDAWSGDMVKSTYDPAGGEKQVAFEDNIPEAGDFDIKDLADSDSLKAGWDGKQDALGYTPEDVSNKRSTFQATPTDTAYPSEKLVKDSLDNKQDILSEGAFEDGDKTKLDNQSGTNTGDEIVATGAEVNTGTDDEKMVTPKALDDSDYIKDSYLSSNNYQQIEVSSTEPSSPTTGDLWLDIS